MEPDRVSHRRGCRPNVFDSGLRDRLGTAVPGPGYRGLATRAARMAGPCSPGTGKVSHPAGPIVSSARGAVPSALARLRIHTILWPFGQHSCVFGCGRNSCVRQLRRRSSRIVVSWMLTERQLAVLRASPPTRRVATAISLAGVTQVTVAEEIGVTQAYVSDVARDRYSTITVASARKFTRFFGCSIDDLFPPRDEGGD